MELTDKPLAAMGLNSYRYKGRYGWIMIGAIDDAAALREASRSTGGVVNVNHLQVHDGQQYIPVTEEPWKL